jgi:hypothetical protein
MTDGDISRNGLLRLHAEILADLRAVEGVAAKALEVRGKGAEHADENVSMALAGFLHHFYTGLESIFERIALAFEGSLPQGQRWHRDLLRSMAVEIPRVRPAVLSEGSLALLEEFLGFRHVFRHAYALPLDRSRLDALAGNLPRALASVREDLLRFLNAVAISAEAQGN